MFNPKIFLVSEETTLDGQSQMKNQTRNVEKQGYNESMRDGQSGSCSSVIIQNSKQTHLHSFEL